MTNTLAAGLVLALCLIATAEVQAQDGKNYPGAMCVRITGGSVTYYFSSIGNASSSSTMLVDCQMIKDTNGTIQDGWVRVKDRHSSQDVDCTLTSVYGSTSDANWHYWDDLDGTSGSSSSHQDITYGSLSDNDMGHYYFSCSIPPTQNRNISYVTTYHIDEN